MKKIILIILGLVLVVAVGAWLYINRNVASLQNQKADVEVSAQKLLEDYAADEKTANEIYLGKVVQVSGKVTSIAEEEGKKKVNLDTGNPISAIICEVENGKDIGSIKAGDEVKMKGLCSGYLSDVILVQANVVK
ncbi:MAG TPA: hypothetical protein VFV79_00225 [Saprospiraceae bacterium]|nr:hypothetical protein [Saprospiraceae bacterium]